MTRRIRVTPATADDIADAYDYYEGQRTGLGEEFRGELHVALGLLIEFSEAGPAVHGGLRRLLLRRFPYAVYYRITETTIVLRACLHQHSDPRIWSRRG